MNILILPSWYPDDPKDISGSFFREQAMALSNSGNNVYVIDSTYQLISLNFLNSFINAKRYIDNGLIVYKQRVQTRGAGRITYPNLLYYKKRTEHLFDLMKKREVNLKIDVIHAHSFFPSGIVACEMGRKYGIPVVITEHFSGILKNELSKEREKLLKYCVENADTFICVGNALADKVAEITGTARNLLHVVPNMYSHIFENLDISAKNNSESFAFLSVGNLIPRKRHEQLIRCFIKAFEDDDIVHLNIAGEGTEREKFESIINSSGAHNKITLLGRLDREKVVEQMCNADAFVLTSSFETFGVVYIEALACGLPVIGSRNGGAQDIINGDNGILVDVDNDTQLIKALRKMKAEHSKYNKYELMNYAKTNFSEKAVVDKLTDIYKKVLTS